MNPWIFFRFKTLSTVFKISCSKRKNGRFTCVKIGNERLAAKTAINFPFVIFLKQK